MPSFEMARVLPPYLREQQAKVERAAREVGLDFFPTIFEVLSYEQMNEVASYGGFPTRYPHWRFGMEYERMAKSYEYGLSKIYEMVINNNPSVAYLLEGNSLVDQKLVMCHVFAHVDFFKNNFAFRMTDQGTDARTGAPIRKWIDMMANHGAVVRRWADRIGVEKVESFIDACLSLENLIDPRSSLVRKTMKKPEDEQGVDEAVDLSLLPVEREYMAPFINPDDFVAEQRRRAKEERERSKKTPERPERDVLGFLGQHAPLERWEREALAVIREEAYYFLPQMQTKIMNEGWATYWHSRLMTEKICESSEIIDYADRCASVLATSSRQLNPYKLGVELFRHIETRWNRGQFGKEWEDCDDLEARRSWDLRTGLGREKIFEVRARYTDVTFIDEFLTPEFALEQKLFSFGHNSRNDRWEIESREFNKVKSKLLAALTNSGQPFISVEDANYNNRGELLLMHTHHGVDLRLDWAREVLRSTEKVWKRPVELHTKVEDRPTLLRFDGNEHIQRSIK